MKLPAGFELENQEMKLPEGFSLEPGPALEKKGFIDRVKGIGRKVADNAMEYYDYLHTPTAAPSSVGDFVTRVIPESISKTTVGALEFLPRTAVDLSEGAGKALNLLTRGKPAEAFKRGMEPIADLSEGIKQFVGRPLGFYGKEPFKEAWTTDPAGSALALYPGAKTLKRRFKRKAAIPQEIPAEVPVEVPAETVEVKPPKGFKLEERVAPVEKAKPVEKVVPPKGFELETDVPDFEPPVSAIKEPTEAAPLPDNVFSRMPDEMIKQQADYGVQGAIDELSRRTGIATPELSPEAKAHRERLLKTPEPVAEVKPEIPADSAQKFSTIANEWQKRMAIANIEKKPVDPVKLMEEVKAEVEASASPTPPVEAKPIKEIKIETPQIDIKNAHNLRKQADTLIKQIEAKLNPAIAQQNVTARRANIAAGMEAEGRNLERIKGTMENIATAIEDGSLPESLSKIKSKAQIEQIERLLRSKNPQVTGYVHPTNLKALLDITKGLKGSAEARQTLNRISDGYIRSMADAKAIETLTSLAEKAGKKEYSINYARDGAKEYKRIHEIGITDYESLKQILADYGQYRAQDYTSPKEIRIREKERALIGTKIPGYFPTPKSVVYEMLTRADIKPGESVLEPSAGKGNIADIIKKDHPDAELSVIEQQHTLRDILQEKGHNIIGDDFLESKDAYDKIIMNPPFENLQDITHVQHAYQRLNPGGKLVSVMSESPFFRSDKKAVDFREWLDSVGGTSEKLPDKAFMSSERPTGVATRIVEINKPQYHTGTGTAEPMQKVAAKTIDLTSGIDPTKIKETLTSLKEDISETLPGRALKEVVDKLHSPQVVFEKMGAKGREIYKTADHYEISKNRFLAKEGMEFEKVTKGIKIDSPESVKVGQALDGKIPPESLSPKERQVYDWMKSKYQFFLQEAAKSAAGNAENFSKALNYANRKVGPMSKVMDLTEGEKQHYKGLKTPNERIEYLHEKWKQTTDEGIVKAHDILSREIKEYLPHIFDKESLLEGFKVEMDGINEKLRTATNDASVKQYKERLKQLEDAVKVIEGGGFVRYSQLPKNIRFRFFETRKGAQGYSFDAVKAYQSYLTGVARKIYDEPAMQQMTALYKDLAPEHKAYADAFLRRYSSMGERGALDEFANVVASFQWMRTLGLNPRSAIVNFTQRVNTIAEIGPQYSLKGEKMAFTEKGKQLFNETGLPEEIPQVLYEGSSPKMEKLRAVVGFMFNKVEMGNRRHAFLSGYLKGMEKLKMSEADAIQYGIDTVHKTQFKYGKVGMPLAMSSPIGRVGLQFWSYPIKQLELMHSWAKNDPKKLIYFLAMAEGGNLTLQQFLDTDLSNALGLGFNWGEALNAFKDLSKADFREFTRHMRLVPATGGGILPSGLGPTAMGLKNVAEGIAKGETGKALKKELTPVVYTRGKQAVRAIANEQDGKYPLISENNRPYIHLTAEQLLRRTLGPKTQTESEAFLNYKRKQGLEQQRVEITREIMDKVFTGDKDGAKKLAQETGVIPTFQQFKNEMIRRKLTPDQIQRMKKPGKKELYQLQKGHYQGGSQ